MWFGGLLEVFNDGEDRITTFFLTERRVSDDFIEDYTVFDWEEELLGLELESVLKGYFLLLDFERLE